MTNIKNNSKLSNEVVQEVKGILEKFQKGYTDRNIEAVDAYMEELFAKDDNIVIIGTSIAEWCLGYEEAKDLVKSDWEYWGDVRIDTENAVISECNDCIWVTTNATVRYEFETNDAKYERMMGFVRSFYDAENDNYKLPNNYKAAHINWVLTQVLYDRGAGKREYQWPLRLSAVLRRYNGKLLFTEMQFCLPNARNYPDVRIGINEDMIKDIGVGKQQIQQYLEKTNYVCSGDIKQLLENFISDCNKEVLTAEDIAQKYFINDEGLLAVGTDIALYEGKDGVAQLIDKTRKDWSGIHLDLSNTITRVFEDTALVASLGIVNKKLDNARVFDDVMNQVKTIIDKDLSDKEKLFRVQRSITESFKDAFWGEELNCCFKLEAILVQANDGWKLSKLQLSLPFYFFFEGMYDVPVIQ